MDFGIYSSVPESDPVVGFINSELSQKRLRFYLSENDLGKALTHLYRSSRTSIEENGANTLYLALGLLKWYETPSSERLRYAPILLMPVEIIRKSAAKGYVIRSREEETMMNITLLEMLRQNFGITVSGLDPLPTDESGVNVKLIYSIIRNSIKNQRKWDVEEQAILGIFSFNKFIMWNDIHNNANKLVQNKIVSSLINGKIEWEAATEEIDATDMTNNCRQRTSFCYHRDSSQLEAIYEAVHDKTFILHGLRERVNRKQLPISSPTRFTKGNVSYSLRKKWLPSPLFKTDWRLSVWLRSVWKFIPTKQRNPLLSHN